MEGYNYLGVNLDNRLDWKCRTEAVYRRGQTDCTCLRKHVNACIKMLKSFFWSVVASATFFIAVSYGSSIRASDTVKLIRKAGSLWWGGCTNC